MLIDWTLIYQYFENISQICIKYSSIKKNNYFSQLSPTIFNLFRHPYKYIDSISIL